MGGRGLQQALDPVGRSGELASQPVLRSQVGGEDQEFAEIADAQAFIGSGSSEWLAGEALGTRLEAPEPPVPHLDGAVLPTQGLGQLPKGAILGPVPDPLVFVRSERPDLPRNEQQPPSAVS